VRYPGAIYGAKNNSACPSNHVFNSRTRSRDKRIMDS
jgi:hypothetical protein